MVRFTSRHLVILTAACFLLVACAGEDLDSEGDSVASQTSPDDQPAQATDPSVAPSNASTPSASVDASPAATPTSAPTASQTPASEPSPSSAGVGDGVLRMGYVLPQTGPIAYLGPPEIAGLQLAVDEVNAAGGGLGVPVEVLPGDEAGDPTFAGQAVDRHIADGADVIVGAGASGISLAIIDRITGAGLLQCSGSNTSSTFTTYDDDGRYFRTAPSNVLQGPVLAEQVVAGGATAVGIISRADDYGESLANSTVTALKSAGAAVVAEAAYDPAAATFDAEVRQVLDAEPDAVVVVAFEEGARILRSLLEAGLDPTQLYGTDGLPLTDLPGLIDESNPAVLAGMTATGASSGYDDDFLQRLQEANPDLDTTLFAPHTYDCGAVFALAAIAAGSDDPAAIAEEVVGVTREGTECQAIDECVQLLEAGEDIDYRGASGPLDFSEVGEPSIAIYDILSLDEQGEVQTVDTVEATTQ